MIMTLSRTSNTSRLRFLFERLRVLFERIEEIILRRDFEFAELQAGLLALLWGAWILVPRFIAPPAFDVLLQVTTKEIWATAFLIVGGCQFAGVIYGMYRLRRISSFSALLLWLFTSLLLGLTDWRLPTFPVLMAFALGSAWGFVRIGRLKT